MWRTLKWQWSYTRIRNHFYERQFECNWVYDLHTTSSIPFGRKNCSLHCQLHAWPGTRGKFSQVGRKRQCEHLQCNYRGCHASQIREIATESLGIFTCTSCQIFAAFCLGTIREQKHNLKILFPLHMKHN